MNTRKFGGQSPKIYSPLLQGDFGIVNVQIRTILFQTYLTFFFFFLKKSDSHYKKGSAEQRVRCDSI
jgi:hypothetical protein